MVERRTRGSRRRAEFTVSGRLEVRIEADDVGKRVSVRSLTRAGPASETFTDTVGVLTSWTAGVLWITRRDGRQVSLAEGDLVAGKVVPRTPAGRRGLPAAGTAELARVAARGWPPVEQEDLGGWRLRAADGFTRRANSVLPLGDPGVPTSQALAYVQDWYEARGLRPYVQTSTGGDGDGERLGAELTAHGWDIDVSAELWIAGLARVADTAAEQSEAASGKGPADPGEVQLSRTLPPGWLTRYQRVTTRGPAMTAVLEGGPSVWLASLPGAGGEAPAAIGRMVVDGRWAGFNAVETDPARRRRGLATTIMSALSRQALEEGASAAYLQVETDNEGARQMYERLGFARHHSYHHWRPGPR
ncbi:GNAT family N-acetyltransferase [Streptomyces sp. P38-E01]|uniref:GNAT family N-acetyltransferase n=1 Tax=Streptomyces tardus TaxID=2780544 RepID=A0A949JHZ5_9ACTN|nr:GNAT family N-acetyltransferase [Streptomyces tardus]MBU7599218.1 GNAT family N-acetyltransferase [Streptomyces tardus]